MSVELITYGSDRRLELGAAEAVRKMVYADDWTVMRIGLQYGFNDVASNITGTPVLRFGVCSGSDDVIVNPTAVHAIGMVPTAATWTYNAGAPSYFSCSTTSSAFKRVGATYTNVTFTGFNMFSTANSTQRGGMFLQITKGSPNYTLQRFFQSSAASAQVDLTDANFAAAMEASLMTEIAGITGQGGSTPSITTLPVDEGVDGILDHLFVYWERTSHKFSFNIRHRKIS